MAATPLALLSSTAPTSGISGGITATAGPLGVVQDGPFLFAAGLAVAAGAVSFASPCVIPLVPGYLSYLVGLVGAESGDGSGPRAGGTRVAGRVRGRAVTATGLFVIGFTLVFMAQSVLVFGVAHAVIGNRDWLMRIGGVVSVVMGLAMLGYVGPLQRERRIHARPSGPIAGALLLGAFFGLGWTVCMGPTLQGVLALAYSTDWNGSAWRGLFLVLFYCAGLGIPFLLLALGFGWATTAMGFLRRHSRTIQVVGAVMLILVGLAMVTGLWGHFVAWLQVRFAATGAVL